MSTSLRPRPAAASPATAASPHPELTASATRQEAAELQGRTFDAYLSSNRTCEIGMTRATGRPYGSIINALDRATRP